MARWLLYFGAFFVAALSLWLRAQFGQPTIQQIIFHLRFLDTLVLDADSYFATSFAIHCLLMPSLIAFGCLAAEKIVPRWLAKHAPRAAQDAESTRRFQLPRALACLPGLMLAVGLLALSWQVSAFAYFKARFGPDLFSSRYVAPETVVLRSHSLKNLVLIYVEGLEATYANDRLFGKDLLAELSAIPGVSFGNYRSAPGTGWTIGGIVGTQCGIPLQIVTRVGRENGENVQAFLPGATCLGDVLHDFGYRNVFMGGAPLDFAGKGKFLTEHHYHETYGYYEFLRNKTQLHGVSGWGLYDDDLFAQARKKLAELHQSGERFNLTVLTLDTHHPEGHYSRYCLKQGAKTFEGIVQCASAQVAAFVEFIRDAGYLKDTNVAIIGDHLAMPNPVYEKLQTAHKRTIFNKFITNEELNKRADELLPFDMFPTIVEFVGIEVEGGRLGLGYSGFGSREMENIYPRPETSLGILNFSPTYERLWVTDRRIGSSIQGISMSRNRK